MAIVQSISRLAVGEDALPTGVVVKAAAAATADVDFAFSVLGARGVIVIINTTLDPASASVTFTLRGVVPDGSGATWDILASAAVAATGVTVLEVHPALAVVANRAASALVPENMLLNCNAVDTDSLTYSVSVIAVP